MLTLILHSKKNSSLVEEKQTSSINSTETKNSLLIEEKQSFSTNSQDVFANSMIEQHIDLIGHGSYEENPTREFINNLSSESKTSIIKEENDNSNYCTINRTTVLIDLTGDSDVEPSIVLQTVSKQVIDLTQDDLPNHIDNIGKRKHEEKKADTPCKKVNVTTTDCDGHFVNLKKEY